MCIKFPGALLITLTSVSNRCLILLPPRHPCVMEVEQVLGFSGGVCFPLVCTLLHLASACVWQIHHRLCGFVIVIRSLVFVA